MTQGRSTPTAPWRWGGGRLAPPAPAPPRPEADPAPGLGAGGPAADRARPPPLPLAARRRLRPAEQRRDGLVSRKRPPEAFLRGAARRLRAADRRGAPAPRRPRAGQRRLARTQESGRPRRDQPGVPAALQSGTPTRRASLAVGRRAHCQSALRHARRPRGRRRRALPAARGRSHPATHPLPLVAQVSQAELITRIPYDGVKGLGTPPRLYNQVLRRVCEAEPKALTETDWVALLARFHLALADAGIVAWQAKYLCNVWRPVVGIREHVPIPGRPDAPKDPAWVPLGAPASNGGKDFTPPFPAYPSGHATFGAACFTVLRRFLSDHRGGGDDGNT